MGSEAKPISPEKIRGLTAPVGLSGTVSKVPSRTQTYNPLLKSQKASFCKRIPSKHLRLTQAGHAHPLPNYDCLTDCDLASLVEAWPELPKAVRAGILAMVRATLD